MRHEHTGPGFTLGQSWAVCTSFVVDRLGIARLFLLGLSLPSHRSTSLQNHPRNLYSTAAPTNLSMSSPVQIAIIGGGIVGLATGLELATRFPGIRLVIIEKEPFLAGHQTSHNSGVIHSGIYYKPGSFKARLCVEGAAALLQFCQEHTMPLETCGKVIVATAESELPRLEELYRRGNANGLKGLRMLMAEQIREIEPHASGIRGIHVPGTSIVDYRRVAEKFGELITRNGGTILLSHEVIALAQRGSETIIETTRGPVETRLVINCAGLHSDRISRMSKVGSDLIIVPVRGEYYDIAAAKQHYVKGLSIRFPIRNSPSSESISQNASEAVSRLVPTLYLP
jgi:L-2-hydroxyglutarate oxidase